MTPSPMVSQQVVTLDLPKLFAARYRAARARPYLAAALQAMTVVSSPSVPTMGVDRYWRCYASPAFVEATPIDELAGVWLHEVAHLLRDHHGRARQLMDRSRSEIAAARQTRPVMDPQQPAREQLRMNLAMDCEINDDLVRDLTGEDGIGLPAGVITPELLNLEVAALFEHYLNRLPATGLHGRLVWHDCGSGAHDGWTPWELGPDGAHPLTPAQQAAIRYRVAEHIRRGTGRVSRGWQRWAEDVAEPSHDWRRRLQAAIRNSLTQVSGALDYTYSRPGRRSISLGGSVLMPSLRRPLPQIAIVIDTSASVADTELGLALGETAGILKSAGTAGNRINVYSCDAAVGSAQQICKIEQITLVGGGGTDLRQGARRALAAQPRPDILIFITDGHTPWPAERPACRTIAGLIGPPPQLDEFGVWHPARPPAWIETVQLGSPSDGRTGG